MKGKLNPNFKFRSGKYAGWTIKEVFDISPGYLNWIYENKPQMLKGAEVQPAPPKKVVPEVADPEEVYYLYNKNIKPATPEEAFDI